MRRIRTPGNISDSLATIETFNPASLGTLALWYDWSRYSLGGSNITDFSGAGRTGTLSLIYVVPGGDNKNVGVLHSSGSVSFSAVATRTVIRALVPYGSIWVLSDSGNYNYHSGDQYLLDSTYAHAYARGGSWRLNGVSINPTATNILYAQLTKTILSGVTTGALSSNRIGKDRTYNNAPGILMEELVWSDALTADQVKLVERYLATKWNVSNYSYA